MVLRKSEIKKWFDADVVSLASKVGQKLHDSFGLLGELLLLSSFTLHTPCQSLDFLGLLNYLINVLLIHLGDHVVGHWGTSGIRDHICQHLLELRTETRFSGPDSWSCLLWIIIGVLNGNTIIIIARVLLIVIITAIGRITTITATTSVASGLVIVVREDLNILWLWILKVQVISISDSLLVRLELFLGEERILPDPYPEVVNTLDEIWWLSPLIIDYVTVLIVPSSIHVWRLEANIGEHLGK